MLEPLPLKPCQDEPVDAVACPFWLAGARDRRPARRDQRPMRFVLGAFGYPPFEDVFLVIRQRVLVLRRGHLLIGVGREDPSARFAVIGPAGDDRWLTRFFCRRG